MTLCRDRIGSELVGMLGALFLASIAADDFGIKPDPLNDLLVSNFP